MAFQIFLILFFSMKSISSLPLSKYFNTQNLYENERDHSLFNDSNNFLMNPEIQPNYLSETNYLPFGRKNKINNYFFDRNDFRNLNDLSEDYTYKTGNLTQFID